MYTEIEVYKKVLSGELKRFPPYFWQEISEQEIRNILHYFFEEILQYTDVELKKNLRSELFYKYKLRNLLNKTFNANPFSALNFTYPDKYKAWEFTQVPNGFWTEETVKEALHWLMQRLNWDEDKLVKKLSVKVLSDNCLGGLLNSYFEGNVYNAINFMYPSKYKVWEIKKVSKSYWTEETKKEALLWFKSAIGDDESKICKKTLRDYGLSNILVRDYKNNVKKLIEDISKL